MNTLPIHLIVMSDGASAKKRSWSFGILSAAVALIRPLNVT
jgi:hypothetical protein